MSLFQLGNFKLASGLESPYKIECDALTDDDWTCIAYLLYQKLRPFGFCEGVPQGGLKLAEKMQKYCTPDWDRTLGGRKLLIVDDVWTTGGSMIGYLKKQENQVNVFGAVVFARHVVDSWVTPLFQM